MEISIRPLLLGFFIDKKKFLLAFDKMFLDILLAVGFGYLLVSIFY